MNKRIFSLTVGALIIFSVICSYIGTGDNETNIELTSMKITVEINSGYAVTELNATIYNPNDENVDGTFHLLLPEAAFISNFSLTLDNVTHYAQVLEKTEAEEKYSEAQSQGKTAGMVEARDMKQFSYTVNLQAYQRVAVTLRYEEFLEKQLGERQYKLALSSMYDEPISHFLLVVYLNSDREIIDLENIEYTDQTTVEWIDGSHAILSITDSDFLPDDDFSFRYSEEALPVNGTFIPYYDAVNEQYYFLHIFSPQKQELGGNMPKDIVFVLDRSGSMSGEKIHQLKDAFSEIIGQLPSDDRFTIIMFNDELSIFNIELLTADENNINTSIQYITSFDADGSTNIYDGLEYALEILELNEGRTPIILLLTDGLPNSGKYSTPSAIRSNIIERNLIQSPIFTLGFGDDLDFDFLTALSLENYATSKKIYIGSDASEQITNFYDTISTTLLRNISIEYDPACEYVYPTSIPSLFEGSETVIAGICSDAENVSSHITAHSKMGMKYFNSTYELNSTETQNIFVFRYWAYSRIKYLIDQITMLGEQDSFIQEIVNLSIQGNFVTPYTALYLEIDGFQLEESAIEKQSENGPAGYPSGSSGGGIPGFELIIVICTIAVALLFRKRR